MAVLISKYQQIIKGLEEEIDIQDRIIANYKKMVRAYDEKVDILQELLRRKEMENEAMAQGSDQLSTSAAADSTVERAVSDSGTSGEGSHT